MAKIAYLFPSSQILESLFLPWFRGIFRDRIFADVAFFAVGISLTCNNTMKKENWKISEILGKSRIFFLKFSKND